MSVGQEKCALRIHSFIYIVPMRQKTLKNCPIWKEKSVWFSCLTGCKMYIAIQKTYGLFLNIDKLELEVWWVMISCGSCYIYSSENYLRFTQIWDSLHPPNCKSISIRNDRITEQIRMDCNEGRVHYFKLYCMNHFAFLCIPYLNTRHLETQWQITKFQS